MCHGIVIDAHVIKHLTPELIQRRGALYSLICWITANCGIAISDRIKIHWEQHCGARERNTRFWEWYFDELHNKRSIHFVHVRRWSGNTWKKLAVKYRIPPDLFVRAIIECADSTSEPRYILADDMLLHDPAAKTTDTATQLKIREQRTGSLCQYLERQLSIILGTINHCQRYFEMGKGACQSNAPNRHSPCPRVCNS
jgi:hypothetical protein